MTQRDFVDKVTASRKVNGSRYWSAPVSPEQAAEGGCGVIGIACSERIAGRHLLQSLTQMRNRGNGKGGGIAAVGLEADQFGVTPQILHDDYLLALAYLDESARPEVERERIESTFIIDHVRRAPRMEAYQELNGLDVRPPEVYQYFVRVRPDVYENFVNTHNLGGKDQRTLEDEIVYQNSFKLNQTYYASIGEKRAFVLSHGKNLLVLKMVAYGDDVVHYYQLEDMLAHVWIGHHRYPTKGRVWHPGGAHPFVGLNEALVHNGDFANYASICEYLSQRSIYPQFLTDTEVSVQVFDLLHRTYDYPLEYVIEAMAPTTELDFIRLPADKQRIYAMLQKSHMHCSPDGPWFFLIAQSAPVYEGSLHRLIGITDTSMLRPQIFALQDAGPGGPTIGFSASEKQAIDAALISLAEEDPRFWPRADKYWNARGGSYTDGGAFVFSVRTDANGDPAMICTDKFGRVVKSENGREPYYPGKLNDVGNENTEVMSLNDQIRTVKGDQAGYGHVVKTMNAVGNMDAATNQNASILFNFFVENMSTWNYDDLIRHLIALTQDIRFDAPEGVAIETLTLLIDRSYPTGKIRRSSMLALCDQFLDSVLENIDDLPTDLYTTYRSGDSLSVPVTNEQTVIVDGRDFSTEGKESLSQAIVQLHRVGFRKIIATNTRGHRFIGNGLGSGSEKLRIDVYGSPGDYLGSGIDGAEIHVHGSGQDQLAQIMKSGKLVIHGDVGQTFGYAAKGGDIYILGTAAGRPMINAVGRPRVVINETCLDYLAESFMAGDPLNGGGFVIVNGIHRDEQGNIHDLDTPYPGSNLFSLASGGAIYIRDPYHQLSEEQLNGGEFKEFSERDWDTIQPHLRENERLFDIPIKRLLAVNGEKREPGDIYRKIVPRKIKALLAEEAWVAD